MTQDQQSFEPEIDFSRARKRRRTGSDVPQRGLQSKPGRRVHCTTEQYEQALVARDSLIQLLKKENKALKIQNEGMKKQLLKEHVCPICRRSYNRSDGLYNHLKNGDDEHKHLAEERYGSRCGTCGKECARWGDLKKHMAVHEQKSSGSAGDLILECDASRCLVAAPFSTLLKGANLDIIISSGVPFLESLFSCVYSSRECV